MHVPVNHGQSVMHVPVNHGHACICEPWSVMHVPVLLSMIVTAAVLLETLKPSSVLLTDIEYDS